MAPEIVLCVCSHAHFSGDQCWCGCTIFTPDDGRADLGGGFFCNGYHYEHSRKMAGDISL